MRVVVAGGGIVGLTVAMGLERSGAEVIVCEQAPEIRAAGASIGLWPNALEVFEAFGIGEATAALTTKVPTWFYDADGTAHRPDGVDPVDLTLSLLPRPQLNDVLASSLGSGVIRLDSKVTGFGEDADHVEVQLDDGTSLSADLLVGADGVHSSVRRRLVPGFDAQEDIGHHAWRAIVPAGDEPAAGSVLTVGHDRARGGYTRTYGDMVTWMVNQFDCPPLTGTRKEQALERAGHLNDDGWNDALEALIRRTPDDRILHSQVMLVPPLPRWTSGRVALIGDAAHALSPHISAGGTLGVEDAGVLVERLGREAGGRRSLREALASYERDRMPRYDEVRRLSAAVESAAGAAQYADRYVEFTHRMLAGRPRVAVPPAGALQA